MKYILLILILPLISAGQTIPKKSNTIIVSGVSFKEVVNKLFDDNFIINKIDSNYNTVQTLPRELYKGSRFSKFILNIRLKDSCAEIKGFYGNDTKDYYTPGSFGSFMSGVDNEIANYGIWGKSKKTPFNIMNTFALSFNKPVSYLTK